MLWTVSQHGNQLWLTGLWKTALKSLETENRSTCDEDEGQELLDQHPVDDDDEGFMMGF